MSIDAVAAAIRAAVAREVPEMLTAAIGEIEQAAQLMREASAGSSQPEGQVAVHQFDQAVEAAIQAHELWVAAVAAAEGIAAALVNPSTAAAPSPGAAPTSPQPQDSAAPAASAAGPDSQQSRIDRTRAALPTYVTSGSYVDEDGTEHVVQSGREPDGEHERIGEYVQAVGAVPRRSGGGVPMVGEHVEAKVAWRMRQAAHGAARDKPMALELVINNDVCEGPMSCDTLLPVLLAPGQILTVHDLDGRRTYRGRAQR